MSSPDEPLAITAAAAVTPVGDRLEQTCASIRAGLARFTETAFYECLTMDPGWDPTEPLVAALAPGVAPASRGPDRILELAIGALRELTETAGLRRRDLAATALVLALPEEDAAVGRWQLARDLAPALCRRVGIDFRRVAADTGGHTAALRGLETARAALAEGTIDHAILLAVDSHLDEERLLLLDRAWRLRSRRGRDGFVPGEAAVALLLETATSARARGAPVLATVGRVGLAEEPATIAADRASTGAGLSAALRALTPPDAPWSWVVCDLNGESYRGFEWSLSRARLAGLFDGGLVLAHPADCTGDVGAAAGAVQIAHVVQAIRRGYAPASRALVWAGADGGLRAAVEIRRVET